MIHDADDIFDVNDKLPEDGQILAYVDKVGWYIVIYRQPDWLDGDDVLKDVTHWAHLPVDSV
jgi:hypothetical protein